MSNIVTLTEKEIMETPNDSELGEKVRQKMWEQKELDREEKLLRENDDENYLLMTDDNGLVLGVHLPKNNPSDSDYVEDGYDKCVLCGKVSPYKTTTHIDLRIGYVEGSGQGCFQPDKCSVF